MAQHRLRQENNGNCWIFLRLRKETCAALSWAPAGRRQLCAPFRGVLHPLSAAAATEFLLLRCPLAWAQRLPRRAVTTPGRGAVKVTPTKPTAPLLLCLFREHRKLRAWFSSAFMSSCSLSAVNITPVSNNLCSLYVVIRKRLTWALFPRQPPPPSRYHAWCPRSIPWRRELLAGLGSARCAPRWEIPLRKRESFLCNRVDLAAFAFLAGEEVMWKALSSPNVTSELGAIMLRCSAPLQLWLGNFEMSCTVRKF